MASEGGATSTESPAYTITVHEAPKFDLKSYISGYKGRTVFRRLFLIASCSTVLREEAATLAVIEAKKGKDVDNYGIAVALLRSISDGKDVENIIEPTWPVEQEKKNAAESKRMENELKQYKNNLIRESIRMGNEDLGQHYHKTGDLGAAVKAFTRMRDFCTTSAHVANTAFLTIAVAIEQQNWLAVQSQVHRIRGLQLNTDQTARTNPKATAAMGLQQMSLREYREAAISFLATGPNLADSYNEVLTSNDVAVYGGLCALASMDRSELQTKVLESASFRNFLELEPHIRRAIANFCGSKYSQCLDILESYRADYLLDIYLQPLVENIYHTIRTKSIVQYFQPFSKVTLALMESMFVRSGQSTDTAGNDKDAAQDQQSISDAFRQELITLIQKDLLPARIDLESQTLVAKTTNVRTKTQKDALDTADAFIQEARLKLLRMAALDAGIEVRKDLRDKSKGAAGGMDLAGSVDENAIPASGTGNFSGQGYSLRNTK